MAESRNRIVKPVALPGDPLWYKDAIIYEVPVRAFCDSDGDGVGDLRGLAQKLDYLQDLGVTALWILPFYPSPLRDDGYDIADYSNIHPVYGTLSDFKSFLREAHKREIRVITELVINHTSDQHPWFQRARRAKPGSAWRDFYVWSKTPEKYKETRIIFKDFESSNWTWDSLAGAYYWHRFYSHQPDLNFDNPKVRRAVFQIMETWLNMGVDGLRLDAVPYLFEREGSNCENLPETHRFLAELRRRIDQRFSDRMLLAEANQWPEDAVAYFGEGDECHMAFHFPLMPRLFMALRMENRFPIIDILEQTPLIPDTCQWALFLRNHDELTLEMVTDEDRDYMYRVYAHDPRMRINLGIRRRLAPLLDNLRRKMELMIGLLFSLPGTPVLYYGDEIGMGDNVYLGDRAGVRTPMQWSADRNAGFSRANPQRLYLPIIIDPEYHYEAINVETEQNNPHSFLWWMKRVIGLRKQYKAFGRGNIEFLHPENNKILTFVRRYENERILVVANLSRFVQNVEVDLSAFSGMFPVEVFGRTEFPAIHDHPYFITLGPHSFYWFTLESESSISVAKKDTVSSFPSVRMHGSWGDLFRDDSRYDLENALPNYIKQCRWFGGKGRKVDAIHIEETIPLGPDASSAVIVLIGVTYRDADPERYVLVLHWAQGETADEIRKRHPRAVIARLETTHGEEGILYDALVDERIANLLLSTIAGRRRFKGEVGTLLSMRTRIYKQLARGDGSVPFSSRIVAAEQSNTSVIYGEQLILKVFRRVDEGKHPDLEIGKFLTEKARFEHIASVAGALEYSRGQREPVTLALLQRFIPNEGDAWKYTLDSVNRHIEEALAYKDRAEEMANSVLPLMDLVDRQPPDSARVLIGSYLQSAQLLGRRTAELHLALASDSSDPDFAPEPFSALYQRSLYQSMRSNAGQGFDLLRKRLRSLSPEIREEARAVADLEGEVRKRFRTLLDKRITGSRIRIHGDFHLGQVLYTGKDFVIIDFEGEPARPLSERRLKRSSLRDVAGMLRSFQYAAYSALLDKRVRPEDAAAAERWVRAWNAWVAAHYLAAYLDTASAGSFLPKTREEIQMLLEAFLLDKAVYEMGYELNNRPDWVRIPLRGIIQLLSG